MAGFARGTADDGACWRLRSDGRRDGECGIARAPVATADRPWGTLVVVGGAREMGRARDAGIVEALATQVGLALGNAACGAPARSSSLRAAATGTTRLGALVRDSLDLARSFLDDVNERCELDIRVRVEGDEDVRVEVERDSVCAALARLVSNTIDASIGLASDITVWVGREGPEAFIAIIDNGVGMDEATRHHLFDTPPATNGVCESASGLTACRAVIERHAGRLAVASTRGVGSTFTVWLPTASGSALN